MKPEIWEIEITKGDPPSIEDFFREEENTHIEYFEGYDLEGVGFHFGEGDIIAKAKGELYYMNLAGARKHQPMLYKRYWQLREKQL